MDTCPPTYILVLNLLFQPILHRIRRQDFSNENGQVIDKIFNVSYKNIQSLSSPFHFQQNLIIPDTNYRDQTNCNRGTIVQSGKFSDDRQRVQGIVSYLQSILSILILTRTNIP